MVTQACLKWPSLRFKDAKTGPEMDPLCGKIWKTATGPILGLCYIHWQDCMLGVSKVTNLRTL